MASLILRLKNKAKSVLHRKGDISSKLPEIRCVKEPSRSEIASQLLAELQGESFDDRSSVITSSTMTIPFPDFDPSFGWEDGEDVLNHVSLDFWGGERPRSWVSGHSNINARGPKQKLAWESLDWATSLDPVVDSDTGQVSYVPVPFILCPGYHYEDPPVYDAMDDGFKLLDGQHTESRIGDSEAITADATESSGRHPIDLATTIETVWLVRIDGGNASGLQESQIPILADTELDTELRLAGYVTIQYLPIPDPLEQAGATGTPNTKNIELDQFELAIAF
ncbi:hypothetical protein AB5N19_11527 [Seiridium cardinale]